MTNYERYKNTYGYRDLMQKHTLSEEGVWDIYGEDANCDWGGHHHEPFLCTVKGQLEHAIQYAVELRSFWQWGAGGRIKKKSEDKIVDVSKLAKNKKRIDELKKLRDNLDTQREVLNKQIEALEN